MYTIAGWVAFVVLIVLVGLSMLPYLLWRAWDNTIPLKKQGRGLDLDYRASKPMGE